MWLDRKNDDLRRPPFARKNSIYQAPEEKNGDQLMNVNRYPETNVMTSQDDRMVGEAKMKSTSSQNMGISTESTNSELNCDLKPSSFVRQTLEVEAKEKTVKNDDVDDENQLYCDRCCIAFDSDPGFILHEQQVHGKKASNQCNLCKMTFILIGDLFLHMAHCQKTKTQSELLPTTPDLVHCHRCSMAFSSKKELFEHLHTHKKGPWTCSECGEVFNRCQLLKAHQRSRQGQFVCLICDRRYDGAKNLKDHEKMWVHRMKVLEQSGMNPQQRKEKEKEFDQENTHQCQLCPLQFGDQGQLCLHEASHEENMVKLPYPCNICHRRFVLPCGLKRHKMIHEKKESYLRFKCRHCYKKLPTRRALTIHTLTHGMKTGQFQCEFCDKRFHHQKNLQMHAHVHTGQRPHQCDQCEWSFKTLAYLRMHKKTHSRHNLHRGPGPHTRKERFPCPQCDAVYVRSHDLKKHLNHFHSETRFECYYCVLNFSSESAWLDHERDHVSGGLIEVE